MIMNALAATAAQKSHLFFCREKPMNNGTSVAQNSPIMIECGKVAWQR